LNPPSTCPLCKAEKITPWYYEDSIVWVADCASHPNKKIVVLKRHTRKPTMQEKYYMNEVIKKLVLGKRWRGPKSIPEHYHLHEL
jgi:hypothetical protein